MLTLSELRNTADQKLRRRTFLQVGALGAFGLTLPGLLRAEAAAGGRAARKSIINLHLDGGPPQMDTIDLKPHAPRELRGEFQPIATNLPGFQICELLPRLALMADKFAFLRSLVESAGRHDAFQCQSGFHFKDLESQGGRPAMGSVLGKLEGSPQDIAPPFVDLMQGRPLVRNSARPGFLGPAFQPFRPDLSAMFARELEPGMQGELARLGADHSTPLTLNADLPLDRLHGRTQLLGGLDRLRREADSSGMMDAMDEFTQQAVSILTSGRLAEALDLDREDPRVLARYTAPAQDNIERFYTAEGPESVKKFLLARRLIEAGARVVSLSFSDFDTHSQNFPRMKQMLPLIDQGLSALVMDLEERGMLEDVTIVAWGEFGRTPRINDNGGRDHWPRVGPALLAGSGLRTGQVIGETDRTASSVIARPITYKDVFATLYHTLGIDPHRITIQDTSGRPQYLLDAGEPIHELV
jgi:hypothetical protein